MHLFIISPLSFRAENNPDETIRVTSSSPKTQFNINVANTSSYTCTSSESSFMIKLLKFSFSLQKFKLKTFSQSLLQKQSFVNFDLC